MSLKSMVIYVEYQMATKLYKRIIIDVAEYVSGARIVRRGKIGPLFEEDHLTRFMTEFEVDCVFDVGANEGQYAEMLRRRANYKGAIISFEPTPALVDRLKIKASKDPNWYIEPIALDREVRATTFNLMAHSQMSSLQQSRGDPDLSQFNDSTKVISTIQITTSTIDFFFSKYKKILNFDRPFLKMDTQGNDLAVFDGASRSISSFVGLQSELAIMQIYENAPSMEESLIAYRKHGFELSAFVPNNAGNFPRLIEIDCIMYRPDKLRRNLNEKRH